MLQSGVHGTSRVPVEKFTRELGAVSAELADGEPELQLFRGSEGVGRVDAISEADYGRIEVEQHESDDSGVTRVT
jgi:hypothetical protein